MKKTVVIYKSSYGSTKKYAEWIAQELKCDLFDTNKVKDDMLVDYDIIIFGGGLYASGINGIALIKSSFSSLRDKDVIVFTVGLADPEKSRLHLPHRQELHLRDEGACKSISPARRHGLSQAQLRTQNHDGHVEIHDLKEA